MKEGNRVLPKGSHCLHILYIEETCICVKERERLENLMSSRVEGWHEVGENEKVAIVNNGQCVL